MTNTEEIEMNKTASDAVTYYEGECLSCGEVYWLHPSNLDAKCDCGAELIVTAQA